MIESRRFFLEQVSAEISWKTYKIFECRYVFFLIFVEIFYWIDYLSSRPEPFPGIIYHYLPFLKSEYFKMLIAFSLISEGYGYCLEDKPVTQYLNLSTTTLSQTNYSYDQQCKLHFGENSIFCPENLAQV